MNNKNNKGIVVILVAVAAVLLLFCGLTLVHGPSNGIMNQNQWTGGDYSSWFRVLFSVALVVLVDQLLFNKEE